MNREEMIEQWETKLYKQATGYVDFIEIAPPAQLSDGVYIEMVVLSDEGRAIAYRYTDDTIDEPWQIGEIADAVDEALNRQRVLAELENESVLYLDYAED